MRPPPLSVPARSAPSATNQDPSNGYNNNGGRHHSPRRPAKSMDEILRHIQTNWKNMEGDECVPVKTALQLMDPSSLGLADKETDFADTHVNLQKCLKGVVNEHYADFNSAVGTYHKIQNAIKESQSRVRQLKVGLMNVKGGMLSTRPELRGLAEQSGELDDMIALLSNIEALKTVPGKLEEKISEKKFLGAVDLLMESLKDITKSELDGIGAISDLRGYFANQESTLLDILVEELHDHLYLKSPYCQDRWKGYKVNGEEKDAKESMLGAGVNAWDRPVYHYLSNLDTKAPMVEDATKNPEADTFYYIHMIVESLHRLGHLDEAISRIEQRMPVELYRVVEKTNNDIDAKYPIHIRGQLNRDKRTTMSLQVNDGRSQVLSDFLWTLYSKFEAIAESHLILHEVVAGIVAREQLAKPERYTSGFKELWKLYQMEMRSLLHDYLATDGDMAMRAGLTTSTSSDVFARQQRDRSKKMFKLSEVDEKSEVLKVGEEELDDILKTSVPGLASKSRTRTGANSSTDANGYDSTAAGHKLLIEPGVFNMTILLPPSLAFLQHLKDIVPQTSHIPMSTLTSFLDDFLINVFLSQLEEAVSELCTQCMIDLDTFSEDAQWSEHSPHPIFKGTIAFMALIRAFSGMLCSIPQDQMFTQLIINQLVTYYDKCYGFYKAIVSRVAPSVSTANANTLTLKAAASYAQSGDIHDIAVQLLKAGGDGGASHSDLVAKEVHALLTATKASPLSSYDIISDPKSVHQLSLLYNSMQWLSSSLARIRPAEASSSTAKSHSRNASQTQNPRRWTLVTSLKAPSRSTSGTTTQVYLPLTSETAVAFDTTLLSFRTLAQTSLLTLHIDIRCGAIHQLTRTLQGPEITPASPKEQRDSSALPPLDSGLYPFVLSAPPSSASPLILELNNDVISFDTHIASFLGSKERRFILSGLAKLVDRFLVAGADRIGVMNRNGAERIRIDAMVVQQNLRSIFANIAPVPSARSTADVAESAETKGLGLGISTSTTTAPASDADQNGDSDSGLLISSSQYYDLFLQGPDEIMNFVKGRKARKEEVGYTYDELRTLIELSFSSPLRGDDREEAVRARKRMQDVLLALGEAMWDS